MNIRPVRVLHLLNSLTGAGCGIVNAAIDLISGQLHEPLEVAVCSNGGEYVSQLQQNGIKHYTLRQKRGIAELSAAALSLRRIVKEFQPDVVHCHMVTGVVLARALRMISSYRVVAHVHNVHQRSSNLMRLADRVIAVSHAVAIDMTRRGVPRRKIRMVHNGTLGSMRFSQVATNHPRELQQPAIVTVGGMNHRKGISELICAFAEVSARVPEAHLYLVGDGPERAEFEAMAAASPNSAHIHFEGFQGNPIPYMRAAHTFVLASRRDSFGLVLTEARACDCAIIASDVDGIPEALDGGEAGLLVPAGDSAALANAILRLLQTPEEHARLKSRARVNLERFHVERMAAQMTDVYDELLVGSGRRLPHNRETLAIQERKSKPSGEPESVIPNATGAEQ